MNFEIFDRVKPRVYTPLVTDEEREERQCKTCKMGMPALHRNQEESRWPWRERGIDYRCDNCQTTTYVANSNSVTMAVGVTLFIFIAIGFILVSGLLDYMLSSFTNSIIAVLISLIALGIMAVAVLYAWSRIKRAATLIEARFENPMANRKPGINMLNLSLTMGLLPWLIAVALGYINQKFELLSGLNIWLMVPFTLLPIIFGRKVGSTKMNVFLAAMFWLFVISFIVWMAT